jgi:hypothetical protein
MYLGLGSLFCSAFTGVPAVILGATALKEASPAAKTKAYVGIGVGSATSGLLMLGAVVSAFAPTLRPAARSRDDYSLAVSQLEVGAATDDGAESTVAAPATDKRPGRTRTKATAQTLPLLFGPGNRS